MLGQEGRSQIHCAALPNREDPGVSPPLKTWAVLAFPCSTPTVPLQRSWLCLLQIPPSRILKGLVRKDCPIPQFTDKEKVDDCLLGSQYINGSQAFWLLSPGL